MDARRFNFAQTAISVTLKLAKFLHTIPHPGTSAFPLVRDGLLDFGLSWKSISFDNRSARLGDAVLKLSLFSETVNINIFSELGGTLQRHKFVAPLRGLLLKPDIKSYLAHRIALRPKRCVVLHLVVHHRVENDGYLMRRRGRGAGECPASVPAD